MILLHDPNVMGASLAGYTLPIPEGDFPNENIPSLARAIRNHWPDECKGYKVESIAAVMKDFNPRASPGILFEGGVNMMMG